MEGNERKVKTSVTGFRTVDGAGVSLVRVLGGGTVDMFDPILMLDSFDSTNPEEYIAGFPMHPHRGIETISLLVRGNMVHRDNLGNKEAISDGEVQWMTAGSGILHEEMVPAAERLLGVQLWLNMPRKDKMVEPAYLGIKRDEIKTIDIDGGELRLLAGSYGDVKGHQGKYLPLDYYQISLEPGKSLTLNMGEKKSVMVFTLLGKAKVAGEEVAEKTAVKLTEGTSLVVQAMDEPIILLYMSTDRLDEPVSWGGPIVMNSEAELQQAFRELQNGTFIKTKLDY